MITRSGPNPVVRSARQRQTCMLRRRRGFTLIEAIASIVVLSVLATLSSSLLLTATDGHTAATVRAQLHNEASITLDRIVREIRRIGLDTAAATTIAPHIDSLTATHLQWRDDVGAASLQLTGTNLMLAQFGGAANVLQGDVSSLTFAAFDDANAALAASLAGDACDAIRRVQITLRLTRAGISETLRTRVYIRSTMTTEAGS